MIIQEKYILIKHANYTPEYIDNAPVYERRLLLDMLLEEVEEQKKSQEKAMQKAKLSSNVIRPRR